MSKRYDQIESFLPKPEPKFRITVGTPARPPNRFAELWKDAKPRNFGPLPWYEEFLTESEDEFYRVLTQINEAADELLDIWEESDRRPAQGMRRFQYWRKKWGSLAQTAKEEAGRRKRKLTADRDNK